MKKRNLILSVAFLLLVLAISSCKTHERCPAYGSYSNSIPLVDAKLLS